MTNTIVLLHGFVASSRYWKRLSGRLSAAGYQVVTLDLLGFGAARRETAANYTYDEHIAYIHRALSAKRVKGPFILVGHSMGAILAARYSTMYPTNVSQLFLLHPPLYVDVEQARTTLRSTGWHYRFLLDSRYGGIGWALLRLLPKTFVEPHAPRAREHSLKDIIEAAELVTDLAKLQIPTVLIVGKKDRPVYRQNLPKIALSPQVRVLIEDVSHHSPITKPELVAGVIARYT